LGYGLYSLACGWITTQIVTVGFAWRRLSRVFPQVFPSALPSLSLSTAQQQLSRGAWISVSQIAQVLLVGSDIMVIGKLLGPEAVVPYACTGRLVNMLANQPQMFMQMALPALSSLRASAPRERLFAVSKSMAQVMLLFSGWIVVVVLAVNRPFVAWWVGESRFGGLGLTGLLLATMVLRHLNATATYTLFCFGNERRLALTSIADGLVGLVVMFALVPAFGFYGAAIGSLVGVGLVSLPNNLRALAKEEASSASAFLSPLAPWVARVTWLTTITTLFVSIWNVTGLFYIALMALVVTSLYAVTMLSIIKAPPLGPMLAERLPASLPPWAGLITRVLRPTQV